MIRPLLGMLILYSISIYADDYSFDMESIETKSFEYSPKLDTLQYALSSAMMAHQEDHSKVHYS